MIDFIQDFESGLHPVARPNAVVYHPTPKFVPGSGRPQSVPQPTRPDNPADTAVLVPNRMPLPGKAIR